VHVTIVGAGLAGTRVAQGLRANGHDGPITLVGAEHHEPYDRPPLSKALLAGDVTRESLRLLAPEEWAELGVDLVLGNAATGLDAETRKLALAGGELLAYDQLVIATGATPRQLPGAGGLAGVHVLRTVDDVAAIRAELTPATRVVVVGAGVLGCEVAATLRGGGHAVSLVEPLPGPLWTLLDRTASDRVRAWHESHGVTVHFDRRVARLNSTGGRVDAVVLDDGTELPTTLVVAAIGAVPENGWLANSGLSVDDGVLCDEHGAALGTDGVWVAGDVARVRCPAGVVRTEHWTNAVDMARIVAANILAGPVHRIADPRSAYVWSDQYGLKLQVVGRPTLADEARVVRVRPDTGAFLTVYGRQGQLVGAAGANQARGVMLARARLTTGHTVAETVAALG
jgi:3-phenylpropionate/trans-cinnamate dioxygenase ferredoxin reductase component